MGWFHRHRFHPVATHHGQSTRTGAAVTAVLRRCSCGEVESELMVGHWTMAELRSDVGQEEER